MVISLRKWVRWIKRFFLFLLCIYFFYQILQWITPFFLPDIWKEKPEDGAIKVITLERKHQDWMDDITNRIYYFYWIGE